MMIWAFVDYENVGSLGVVNIPEYERMFVFCGPKNTRIKFGALPSNGFCSIELIAVTTMGSNNLDFHLAFHVGRFHEIADKNVTFHIISNDSGFNGLVNHLKNLGRKCKKISTRTLPCARNEQLSLGDCASLIFNRLKELDGRKRPRKRAKFLNWVKSQCQGIPGSVEPETVFEELVKAGVVLESGSDITYEL
ncbi:MAG: PIN domain-containing protein [Gammaproteobacteria bacterium]